MAGRQVPRRHGGNTSVGHFVCNMKSNRKCENMQRRWQAALHPQLVIVVAVIIVGCWQTDFSSQWKCEYCMWIYIDINIYICRALATLVSCLTTWRVFCMFYAWQASCNRWQACWMMTARVATVSKYNVPAEIIMWNRKVKWRQTSRKAILLRLDEGFSLPFLEFIHRLL